ncbi:MAG TPA: hypothetical protein VFN30_01705 [Chitinophagaceae bacterium]|nr:hypothetical protein [Chitinophagaceae bacterium]
MKTGRVKPAEVDKVNRVHDKCFNTINGSLQIKLLQVDEIT